MHRRIAAVVDVDVVAIVVAIVTTGFLVWQGCHDSLVGMQGQQDRRGCIRKHFVVSFFVVVVPALFAIENAILVIVNRICIVGVVVIVGILGLFVPVVRGTHSNQISVGGVITIAVAIVLLVVLEWFLEDALGSRYKGVFVVVILLLLLLLLLVVLVFTFTFAIIVIVIVLGTIVLALGFVLAVRNGRGGSLPKLPNSSGGRGIDCNIEVIVAVRARATDYTSIQRCR